MNFTFCPDRSLKTISAIVIASALGTGLSAPADADTITFGGLSHGQVVPATIRNVSFSVVNHAPTGFDEGRISIPS